MKDGLVNAKYLDKIEAAFSVFYLTDHEYSDVSFQSCHTVTPRNVGSVIVFSFRCVPWFTAEAT